MNTKISTFHGNKPDQGSVLKLPSLAKPNTAWDKPMPISALRRQVSKALVKRGISRLKLPRLSVSKPSTRHTWQPKACANTGAITRSLPCMVKKLTVCC